MTELLKEIWSTSKRNKLRTTLTGFAVAWGIFMIIFLLGAGNGLINAQMQQSDERLSNSIVIFGGYTSKAHNGLKEGRPVRLDERDADITYNVNSVLRQEGINISLGDSYVSAQSLLGVYPADILINKRKMREGRFINDIDLKERRKVIVLHQKSADILFGKTHTEPIGQFVNAGGVAYQVVGIYNDQGNSEPSEAYIPFSTLQTIYNKGNKLNNILLTTDGLTSLESNEAFEAEYRRVIGANHRFSPDDTGAIWIWNRFTDYLRTMNAMGILRTAIWVIGIFTLLSGIVGVSNIMLITVRERTHEFGIRKAIGAKPWSILRLIIIESVAITTFFGYIGMLLGIAANQYMDATIGKETIDNGLFAIQMFTNPTVGFDTCIKATLLMIFAGTLAGLIPARKAARIRPIEALRAE